MTHRNEGPGGCVPWEEHQAHCEDYELIARAADRFRAERDRYREALEKIFDIEGDQGPGRIAGEALDPFLDAKRKMRGA